MSGVQFTEFWPEGGLIKSWFTVQLSTVSQEMVLLLMGLLPIGLVGISCVKNQGKVVIASQHGMLCVQSDGS